MAAAAYTVVSVPGVNRFQKIGQFDVRIVDVRWASTVANSTADATITKATLGFTSKILGAQYLGEGGALGTISDHPGQCTVQVGPTGASLVISALTAPGVALDLDDTDICSVRLAVWGI